MRKKFFHKRRWQKVFAAVYGLLFILQMSSLGLIPSEASATITGGGGSCGSFFGSNCNSWDRSSLKFSFKTEVECGKITAKICNQGDGAMAGPVAYEVWSSAHYNPTYGAKVGTGQIPALGKGECTYLEYQALFAGNYKFKAFQRPGHPGSGTLWSGTISVYETNCDEPVCGDGKVDPGEECDDGNTNNNDACNNQCQKQSCTCKLIITKSVDKADALPGETLKYTISYENTGSAVCTGTGVKVYDPLDSRLTYVNSSKAIVISNDGEGDGYLPTEGNNYNGHGNDLLFNVNRVSPGESGIITFEAIINANAQCGEYQIPDKAKIWSNQTDYIWSNEVVTNVKIPCTYCGDGLKQSPNGAGTGGPSNDGYEACDGTDGVGEHQACSATCTLIDLTYCGDGTKQTPNDTGTGGPLNDGNEACDGTDGVGEHQSCNQDCTLTDLPYCGNSVVDPGEECDDGNDINTDDCLIDCTLPVCGDGNIWQGYETCDDNGNNGLACTPVYGGQCSYCSGVCEPVNLTGPYCGDGIKNGPEVCDGTEGVGEHQACSATCTLIDLTYCGDGIKQTPNDTGSGGPLNDGNEACDGNEGVGEHQTCSQTCTLIDVTYCGDGKKQSPNDAGTGGPANDGYEDCDGTDGVGAHQSCDQSCTLTDLPYCGNGVVENGEECDDGNQVDTDGCKNNCTLPSICADPLDVALVMDRSGSMGYTSACEWWQFKCINPPSCSLGYSWVKNITNNQNQAWCTAKNQAAPHNSVWTEYNPVKITAAKNTANNFLNLLGVGDQSALVSFANNATLDKLLSNNHSQTQTAVNALVTTGATDIGDAIKLGAGELVSSRINPLASQVMILLTDGMANKPSGPGYGEYPADVAYSLAKATEAAAAGIKIFTIGLGADINATMLQQIAALSGGEYYFAPTAQDLDAIFVLLRPDVCGQEPVCGNGLKEAGEECDGTEGVGPHQTCSQDCTLTDLPYCGNGVVDPGEECDGLAGVGPNQSCSQTCTLTDLPYCGDSIVNGTEECDDGNQVDTDECKNNCTRPSICAKPLDIMFIMDRSGSMGYDNPTRLSLAKTAANNFIGKLRTGDQSGLVSYANTAILDKTLSNSHATTQTKVNALAATGATNIGDAIKLSNTEFASPRSNPLAMKVAILLTDGYANKPNGPGYGEFAADVAYAKAKADEAALAGIKIYTIGLGASVNTVMLQYMATVTGGQYYFAPSAADLQAIFDQIAFEACGKVGYQSQTVGTYARLAIKNQVYVKLELLNKLLLSCA